VKKIPLYALAAYGALELVLGLNTMFGKKTNRLNRLTSVAVEDMHDRLTMVD
jgi:hypothetical protein